MHALSELLEDDFPESEEPVWILGQRYDVKTETSALLCDVRSRLWFTYRNKFSPIGGTGPSSDTGWGCMLRCGQMILAQALLCNHLGRTQMGVGEGKSVGEWYGPNTVAQVLRCDCPDPEQVQAPCPVSQQNLRRSLDWRPLLLLIPLRMGINNINPIYIQTLKECFKMPQSCGILGGKPNLAYYFIGFIDDELIYLDPHTTQSAVDSGTAVGVDDQSYHPQRSPHRMKISSLDPSLALEILKKKNLRMFELVEKHPSHWPPFIPPTRPEVPTTGAGELTPVPSAPPTPVSSAPPPPTPVPSAPPTPVPLCSPHTGALCSPHPVPLLPPPTVPSAPPKHAHPGPLCSAHPSALCSAHTTALCSAHTTALCSAHTTALCSILFIQWLLMGSSQKNNQLSTVS
ncbi:Cysteine protease ATG4A [Bagarius yarrelli]|uniref:Cysteine protease n=1 Tax=Bagarius yarrelli TaxID=175774 RepID=A0A556VVP7_BAGYA|nr:Cysteine protease ATG4A [Bagarius yarrelli]